MMRDARLYRYQLALASGTVLRDQRVDSRQGLLVCLRQTHPQAGKLPESDPWASDLWENHPLASRPQDGGDPQTRDPGINSPETNSPETRDPGTNSPESNIQETHSPQTRASHASQQGWGEIAPLPGISRESLADACAATVQWLDLWRAGVAAPLPQLPSVAFGLSCALAELEGQLPVAATYQTVPLLILAADQPPDLTHVRLAKCKAGRLDARDEAEQVNRLLNQYPQLHLRLDANRAWTPQQARQFARRLRVAHRQRIVFIEEPCQHMAQSCAFSAQTGIAIAWDESLRESPVDTLLRPGVAALVIKPTLTGSLAEVRQLLAVARANRLAALISSSVESSLGLTQLARLAHWLTPQTLPGLDTLNLLSAQLIRRWPASTLPCLTTQQLEQCY